MAFIWRVLLLANKWLRGHATSAIQCGSASQL